MLIPLVEVACCTHCNGSAGGGWWIRNWVVAVWTDGNVEQLGFSGEGEAMQAGTIAS
jgi:hypothetical protein